MVLVFLFFVLTSQVLCEENYKWNTSALATPPWGTEKCASNPESCIPDEEDDDCGNMCPSNENCTVNVALILPNSTNYFLNLNESKKTLQEAVITSKTMGILNEHVKVNFLTFDDKCRQEYATYHVLTATRKCSHVIFGPVCIYCLAGVGRIGKFIGRSGIPIITPGGFASGFTDNKTTCDNEFYSVINTGPGEFRSLSEFFHLIVDRYKWKKVALMYERSQQQKLMGDNACEILFSDLMKEINVTGMDFADGDLELTQQNYTDYLVNIGIKYGIILVCTSAKNARKMFIEAFKMGMMDLGEYIFFNFELYPDSHVAMEPWYVPGDDQNDMAKEAYRSVFTFTPWLNTNYSRFTETKNRASIYLDALYDGWMLFSKALNETIKGRQGNESITGIGLVNKMMGLTFLGKHGEEVTNCNGQKLTHFALVQTNETGQNNVVAEYIVRNRTITNWKVKWPNDFPWDTPKCGYNLAKCPKFDMVRVLTASLVSLFCSAVLVVTTLLYRHYKFKKELYSMAWKISSKDFNPFENGLRKNSQASVDRISVAGDKVPLPKNFGFYKGNRVMAKRLKSDKIELTKANLKELKLVHHINHEHLVKFYGACFEGPIGDNFILTEFCSKGTLDDVLQMENTPMDLSFRLSLITDIVRGMHYIHCCDLKFHGDLRSTHCLVDNRFSVKIAYYGLRFLKEYTNTYDTGRVEDVNSHAYWAKFLWTAPEILRANEFSLIRTGSQKGDVYSFGIIMHEIITRQGVFYLGHLDNFIGPREIVETVRKGPDANNGQPLRPYLDDVLCEDEVSEIMKKCWNESQTDRLDFNAIKNRLKQINKDSKGNFVNNLLARMEQYANNLETLVEERTADYLEEKRKCEELLYQLLPKTVAQQLIGGNAVVAESFDSVTIYFSDIVEFTVLSAKSTPLEVVDLLNDLYTCFDSIVEDFDVYKVETIGDAYMVVSGLPERNGNNHAQQIARMSLRLLHEVRTFEIKHRPGEPLQLRIGIHTGPCVAGVVGLKMPRYCLFGDTVNTASRMESHGEALKIHVSPVTKKLLDTFGTFDLERRGETEIKGKGKMTTYWLKGERPSLQEQKPKLSCTAASNAFRREIGINPMFSNDPESGCEDASDPLLYAVTPSNHSHT